MSNRRASFCLQFERFHRGGSVFRRFGRMSGSFSERYFGMLGCLWAAGTFGLVCRSCRFGGFFGADGLGSGVLGFCYPLEPGTTRRSDLMGLSFERLHRSSACLLQGCVLSCEVSLLQRTASFGGYLLQGCIIRESHVARVPLPCKFRILRGSAPSRFPLLPRSRIFRGSGPSRVRVVR